MYKRISYVVKNPDIATIYFDFVDINYISISSAEYKTLKNKLIKEYGFVKIHGVDPTPHIYLSNPLKIVYIKHNQVIFSGIKSIAGVTVSEVESRRVYELVNSFFNDNAKKCKYCKDKDLEINMLRQHISLMPGGDEFLNAKYDFIFQIKGKSI